MLKTKEIFFKTSFNNTIIFNFIEKNKLFFLYKKIKIFKQKNFNE